jgi:hypothetical protein
MDPNFALETNALRYIYTEKLVVFQDSRDTLLRDFDYEADADSAPTPVAQLPAPEPILEVPNAVVISDEKEETLTKPTETVSEPIAPIKVLAPQLNQNLVVLGSNNRNILVLLPGSRNDLKVEEREFLLKILAAKQLKGNDIGFVFEMENSGIVSKAALLASKPQLVIAFGLKQNLLTLMPAMPYSLIAEENILFLKSDALLKLTIDTNLKKQLWSQLHPLVLG